MAKHHFICVGEPDRSWVYTYDDGIYHPKGRQKIHKIVVDELNLKASKNLVSEITHHIYAKTVCDELPETSAEWLCVENGILNVLTKEFIPHTPEQVHVQKIPVKYDPQAKCVEIEKFLKEVSPNWNVLQKWAGYCLLKDYRFHNVLMAHGGTHSGKSTYFKLVKALIGSENASNIPMQRLEEDRFKNSAYNTHKKILKNFFFFL